MAKPLLGLGPGALIDSVAVTKPLRRAPPDAKRDRARTTSRENPRVCTESLIRIDCVTESPNVNGNERALLPRPDPVRLAVQVEEPT
jgi:hypothetical protein